MPSLSRLTTFYDKKKYKSISDLKHLSPIQIIEINPKQIRADILRDRYLKTLFDPQQTALKILINQIKKNKVSEEIRAQIIEAFKEKLYKDEQEDERSILGYAKRSKSVDNPVDRLLKETAAHVALEKKYGPGDDLTRIQMGLDKLNGKTPKYKDFDENLTVEGLREQFNDAVKSGPTYLPISKSKYGTLTADEEAERLMNQITEGEVLKTIYGPTDSVSALQQRLDKLNGVQSKYVVHDPHLSLDKLNTELDDLFDEGRGKRKSKRKGMRKGMRKSIRKSRGISKRKNNKKIKRKSNKKILL